MACALVGALAGVLVSGCATMDAESRENIDAPGESSDPTGAPVAPQRVPPPSARKPKRGDGTLEGRVSLKAAGATVSIASFLSQTGATSVEIEAGGERFPIAHAGTFEVRLDSGTFRIDHLELNGPGDRRRALFFAPVLVDVEGAAACLGRFDLAWGSVKDLIRLETPRS